MTKKSVDKEDRTIEQVKKLSDTFLNTGFLSLRGMPGDEEKETTALASYVQILQGDLLKTANVTTPGYIVRLIPKGASWQNDVQVSFITQSNEMTRVAVKVGGNTVYLGEDPNFKVLLGQVVQSLAEVLRAS